MADNQDSSSSSTAIVLDSLVEQSANKVNDANPPKTIEVEGQPKTDARVAPRETKRGGVHVRNRRGRGKENATRKSHRADNAGGDKPNSSGFHFVPVGDSHTSCKTTIASLTESLHHWKSAVLNILNTAKTSNALPDDVKLAVIRDICCQAEKNAHGARNDQNKSEQAKRNIVGDKSDQGKKDEHGVELQQSPDAANKKQRHQKRIGNSSPQSPLIAAQRSSPANAQRANNTRRPPMAPVPTHQFLGRVLRTTLGVQLQNQQPGDSYANGNRSNRYSLQHRKSPSQWPYQNQDPSVMHMHYVSPSHSLYYPGAPFSDASPPRHNLQYLNGQPRQSSVMEDLPLLNSAAESNHPVCVFIRERLRTADDEETLNQWITKAEAHKIQDLVDRGRRKLMKVKQQQQQ